MASGNTSFWVKTLDKNLWLHNESPTYKHHSSWRRPLACGRWRHVVPVGVPVDQQSCGPGQTQLCQYWARPSWGMAISHGCFLHALTSGCLTSSSNCRPHGSIILPLLSRSHHNCAASLFDAFKKTGTTVTSHTIEPQIGVWTPWRQCDGVFFWEDLIWKEGVWTPLIPLCDKKC